MTSVDAYVEPQKRSDESFADFTQFPDANVSLVQTVFARDSNLKIVSVKVW